MKKQYLNFSLIDLLIYITIYPVLILVVFMTGILFSTAPALLKSTPEATATPRWQPVVWPTMIPTSTEAKVTLPRQHLPPITASPLLTDTSGISITAQTRPEYVVLPARLVSKQPGKWSATAVKLTKKDTQPAQLAMGTISPLTAISVLTHPLGQFAPQQLIRDLFYPGWISQTPAPISPTSTRHIISLPTLTPTPTSTNTPSPTSRPTETPRPTHTTTATATPSPTNTTTPTKTPTQTKTPTPTKTPSPTATTPPTATPTATLIPSPTAIPSPTLTPRPTYDFMLAEFYNSPTSNPFLMVYVAIVDPNEIPIGDMQVIGTRLDTGQTFASPLSTWHYEGYNAPSEHIKSGNVKFEPPGGFVSTQWVLHLVDAHGQRQSEDIPFEVDQANKQWYFIKLRRKF